jgi:hypothetical protein
LFPFETINVFYIFICGKGKCVVFYFQVMLGHQALIDYYDQPEMRFPLTTIRCALLPANLKELGTVAEVN